MEEQTTLAVLRKQRGWSQEYLAVQIGASPGEIGRWERGERRPSPLYLQRLCEIFGRNAVDLGFRAPAINSIDQPYGQLVKQLASIHHLLNRAYGTISSDAVPDLEGDDLMLRRELMKQALSLLGVSIVPTPIGMVLPEPVEAMLPRWRQALALCWSLYFEGAGALAEQALPSLMQQTTAAARESGPAQRQAAALASQALQLDWLLNLQQLNFGQAAKSARQAQSYAELAGDPALIVASLLRRAHVYFHLKQPQQKLAIQEQALALLSPELSPGFRVWIAVTSGEAYAALGEGDEARKHFDEAHKLLPEVAASDPVNALVPVTRVLVANYEVLSAAHVQEPNKGLKLLGKLAKEEPIAPLSAELRNRELLTFIALGERDEAVKLLPEAAQAARQVGSLLRLSEVQGLYTQMCERWPQERPVRELAPLIR